MENRATSELIDIIRTLFYNKSDTNERDRLVKRVESEFAECDKRIDMYIRSSSKDLTRLIKVFNDISKKIEHSRTTVAQSREALKQCKILLQAKRDDVRRLLIEWWEQKSFYENISKLKDLYLMPDNIRTLYGKKEYLEAAKAISNSIKMLDTDYREIIGLHEVKRHIEDERMNLEKHLYQELSDLFYNSVQKSVLESGSMGLIREFSFKRRFLTNQRDSVNIPESSNDENNTELNDETIQVLVKSAATLNNSESNINILEKMINDINKNMNNELLNIVHATSNHVLDSNLIDNTKVFNSLVENNPKLLNQLIELSFEQFKLFARYYRTFINFASEQSHFKYQTNLVWVSIQNVLVTLLEEYLDVKRTNMSADNSDRVVDINSYFAKKRFLTILGDNSNITNIDDNSNRKVFSFKASSHLMNVDQYIKEKNNEGLFKGDDEEGKNRLIKILVCQPSHRNITTIFMTMEHISKEISDEIRSLKNVDVSKPDLSLEKFLQDFILNTFIANAVQSITENANINSNNDKYEISKQLISLSKQRELNLNKPILQNTWLLSECCYDLFNLMKDMNSYASEFAKATFNLLEKHLELCNKLFFSIVRLNTDTANSTDQKQNYVYSMMWVQDDSINKYFKQLPGFSDAIRGKASVVVPTIASTTVNTASMVAANEVQQVNYNLLIKEVDTLISNLIEKELDEVDIITNYNYIELIAHIHESCDWFINQFKFILNSIEQMIKNPKSLNCSLSLAELSKLNKQVEEFEKLRGNSLLLLYLETRVHCFYHLNMLINQENNNSYAGDVDTDPDESILNMNRDLHRIHEHLSRSLQETKVNYVFDALGFMIATIFIKSVKNLKKVSTHGIAKMLRNIFHVEQNLSAMRTKADPHLMKAHRFYELLYKKPEEFINHLQENEAEFQLNDYVNLLNLIYRSQPGYEINSLSDNIQVLTNILKRKY